MEVRQRFHKFYPLCHHCKEYTGIPIPADGIVLLREGEPTGCPVWFWGNDGDFNYAGSECSGEIEAENERWCREINRGRLRSIARVLKTSPTRINPETYKTLADYLLTLPETGKPGRKPNPTTAKLKRLSVYDAKKEKTKQVSLSTDPAEDKRAKALIRQDRHRLKTKSEATAARLKLLGKWLLFSTGSAPHAF